MASCVGDGDQDHRYLDDKHLEPAKSLNRHLVNITRDIQFVDTDISDLEVMKVGMAVDRPKRNETQEILEEPLVMVIP